MDMISLLNLTGRISSVYFIFKLYLQANPVHKTILLYCWAYMQTQSIILFPYIRNNQQQIPKEFIMIQKFIYPEFDYGSVSLKEKVGQTFVKVYSSDICNGKILRLAILYVTVYRKQIFRLRLTDKLQFQV